MTRRVLLCLVISCTTGLCVSETHADGSGEWLVYGSDKASSKYSPVDQIHKDNVQNLQIAWRWKSVDNEIVKKHQLHAHAYEATPLMVDGVLYTSTSLSQVAAIDAASGKTIWVYDPKTYESGSPAALGFVHRGVAYWNDGEQRRIFIGTCDAYLIALDADTGKPVPEFGENGRIDLTKGLRRPVDRDHYSISSPPLVCRDVVVVGSAIMDAPLQLLDMVVAVPKQAPPGDVRAFDVRTGKQHWIFHSVPQEGEFGKETWEGQSWKEAGNTNVWSIMSYDEELGYVYLPFGTPTNDWYGGRRHGDNLFAESLVCLNAETGERVWHFQTIHHGVWDYDLPAAPNLVDITVDGHKIKAVAQVSKQGFCYVFNRVTGEPVWPIEEGPVPQATIPGEKLSPTQPFPTKPLPFDRQGISQDEIIDFTPEIHQQALDSLKQYDYGPLYTPPTERPTIDMPGWAGGASWAGAAFDPETGFLYVPSITSPIALALAKLDSGPGNHRYSGVVTVPLGPEGLPLVKPPYGRITAIDLNTGDHAWMVPHGSGPRDHPLLTDLDLPPLGSPFRGHIVVTKTLLFAGQEGSITAFRLSDKRNTLQIDYASNEPKFRAFDKATGDLLAEIDIPNNVYGAPMTYMTGGKQYIVFPVGGGQDAELIALSLP